MKHSGKIKLLIIILLISLSIAFIVAFPKELRSAARYGLALCGEIIIPSLFPFTCLAVFISTTEISNAVSKILRKPFLYLFGADGNIGLIFLLSIIGGYPVGSKLISRAFQKGEIDTYTANTLLTFSINGGPAFIIVAVGSGMFMQQKVGFILFSANLLASIVISAFMLKIRKCRVNTRSCAPAASYSEGLIISVSDTCSSLINICGYVILFSCISKMLNTFITYKAISETISMFLEVTNGSLTASKSSIYLVAAVISWAGLAIHCQVFSICKGIKIEYKLFYISRTVHASLTVLFTYLIEKLFPITVSTSAMQDQIKDLTFSSTALSSLSLIVMSAVVMVYGLSISKQNMHH